MIGFVWSFLLNNRFTRLLSAVLAALVAVFAYGRMQKRAGRKEAEHKAKEADNAKAKEIRDNVRDNLDDRVRKYDGHFRD